MKKNIIFCIVFLNIFLTKIQAQEDPINCDYPTQITLYVDNDRDGRGNSSTAFTEWICTYTPRDRTATVGGDCNDNDPNIQTAVTWYRDKDGDTYGSNTVTTTACTKPSGYVRRSGDCNDNDRNLISEERWYIDSDGDGKGAYGSTAIMSCGKPSGSYVRNAQDCNDNDANNWQNSAWYVDTDDDGLGEGSPVISSVSNCQPPNDGKTYVDNNDDRCPGVYGEENGCPPPPPPTQTIEEAKNTIKVTQFDVTGKIVAQSKSYFDDLGKAIQVQSKDFKTGETWASETLYDSQGRPALQTLSAPTNRDISLDFFYKPGFIKNANGTAFSVEDFENDLENPSLASNQENTAGWYYSTNNTSEPYQDITQRPYSRTIYSDLNPGTALKTIGGNKIDGQWKNAYVFSMPAGQELSSSVAFNDPKYNNYKIIKTISRDVHGVENVLFTDTDGNTLAAAQSGGTTKRNASVFINDQGYADVHIPKGTTGVQLFGNSGIALDIYNLITEKKTNIAAASLPNGFYRIAVRNVDTYTSGSIRIQYEENYYDYSLNYYDKAGRLLSSKQPLNHLESTFQYNSLGQLETTKSPDEGEAWFHYRQDGQIRLSINIQQLADKKISFTDYDSRARPVASGVIIYPDLTPELLNAFLHDHSGIDASDPLAIALFDESLQIAQVLQQNPDVSLSEVHQTLYDISDESGLAAVFGTDPRLEHYKKQSFVAGNVSKTSNENTTTWYNYDIYGRVQWIVQNITDLGVKTIDYEYHPVTSQVDRVVYQKGQADQFIHRYTYDPIDYSLIKVETSTDDSSYTEHASYEYYETGGLKRTNIAQGLQGIDYIYNIQGALKSINHPSLAKNNDPGGDDNDRFGMQLHYYNNDYTRANTPKPIARTSGGIDQYNGNIKAITWNTKKRENSSDQPNSYYYKYNKRNWLEGASFNQPIGANSNIDPSETRNQTVTASETLVARESIVLLPGFTVKATATLVFRATIDEGTNINTNGDYNVFGITYDANGNIQKLNRNKSNVNGSNAMDKLSYTYKTDKPNQLLSVSDAAGSNSVIGDIGNQDGANYTYNAIGQLTDAKDEKITYLYNASGLVTEVKKDSQTMLKFFYNDKGHRVRKESFNPLDGASRYTEHYVRDAAGSPMAIYRNQQIEEYNIYGTGRLGVYKEHGARLYQLTDHLGNIRAVVGRDRYGNAMPEVASATDYYPFGMPMPGRNLQGDYRYAYQGQEKDTETGKEAFQLRLWDARIGRWLTTDPYGEFSSPYLGMGNNPISNIDPDGGCVFCGIRTEDAINIAIAAQTQLNTVDLGIFNWNQGESMFGNFSFTNVSPLPGVTPGIQDMKGTGLVDGVSVSVEFASPVKIPFTEYYGFGLEYGTVNLKNPSTNSDTFKSFLTGKTTKEPGVAFGFNVNYFGFENRTNEPITAERFTGQGTEAGGNLFLGYSISNDGVFELNKTHTYNVHSVSIGAGIDYGFSEWKTSTTVFE